MVAPKLSVLFIPGHSHGNVSDVLEVIDAVNGGSGRWIVATVMGFGAFPLVFWRCKQSSS